MCQAYHWSFDKAMSLTLPQMILMNHAAWVNQKRSEEKAEQRKNEPEVLDPVVHKGKKVTELNSDEFGAYWGKSL